MFGTDKDQYKVIILSVQGRYNVGKFIEKIVGEGDESEAFLLYGRKIINSLLIVKKKVATKKKLMPEREVTVKSRAYGEHTRAARGSKTLVGLNTAYAEHNAKTVTVNNIAK